MSSLSKTSIDQLGDRLRSGKVSEGDLRLLDTYRRSFSPPYEIVIATIRTTVGLDPTGRPAKSTTSITEKLHRETIRLTQMQDVAGCRLVVADIEAQDATVEDLKRAFSSVDVVDRRSHPSHGYRAVHLITTVEGKHIEIQVRTTLQHLWAEFSEKLSDVIDPAIKYGGGPTDVKELLEDYVDVVKAVEEAESKPEVKNAPAGWLVLKERLRRSLEKGISQWS
jgi:putative GTP pyrophosphokinase